MQVISRGSGPQSFGLGLGVGASNFDTFKTAARAADDAGFQFVSVGDNPEALKETYVSLTVLAGATSECWIGTSVTNPIHRDPVVVASALSSVESLAPGRVFLGIATGRARRPGTIEELRTHIATLRALWAKGEATVQGETVRMKWDARPVPIVVCVSGPRGLRLAGEVADGVIIETGVSVDSIRQVKQWIAEGARVAGRDPEEIQKWWYLKSAIADTHEEAMNDALAPVAASGGLVLGGNPAGRAVPDEFHDECRRLLSGYDKDSHFNTTDDDPNRKLLGPGPFLDYLFDRFALAGTPKEWLDRIDQLKERGVDGVFCAAVVPDIQKFVSIVGQSVIPSLSTTG